MIKQKIQENIITALKSKDEKTLSVLRYLSSQIHNKEIDKKQDLSNEEVIQLIRKQIKDLKEAILMFQRGDRQDLVCQNQEQIKILSSYLPAELSDEQLKREIKKIIEVNKNICKQNPKALMGICIKTLKSKADPKRIIGLFNQIIQAVK
jgi:uncharacterized protein YqeY